MRGSAAVSMGRPSKAPGIDERNQDHNCASSHNKRTRHIVSMCVVQNVASSVFCVYLARMTTTNKKEPRRVLKKFFRSSGRANLKNESFLIFFVLLFFLTSSYPVLRTVDYPGTRTRKDTQHQHMHISTSAHHITSISTQHTTHKIKKRTLKKNKATGKATGQKRGRRKEFHLTG